MNWEYQLQRETTFRGYGIFIGYGLLAVEIAVETVLEDGICRRMQRLLKRWEL